MPLISHTDKFIFISNARTGSTSMMKMLDIATNQHKRHYMGVDALPVEYHMGISETIQHHPEIKDYFKFCFVRNPWDRFVSAYKEFTDSSHHLWNSEICGYPTFRDFCLNFKKSNIRYDIHYLSIVNQISINGIIEMDYIARFEEYEKEVLFIFNKLNLQLPNIIHARQTNKTEYRSMYDEETKNIIHDYYRSDVNMFGYSF